MDAGKICRRFDALESQRRNLDNVLQEVERWVVPYRGEFYRPLTSEHEVKWRRREIWSGVPVNACALLASHMHGSLTSPSVQWFGLQYRDQDWNDDSAAKEWLEDCEFRMWSALIESDFNSESPEVYLDIASMGTSIFMMEPKTDIPGEWDGMDFTVLPVADTYFEMDAGQQPVRIYRRLRYTGQQLVDRFDLNPKEHAIDVENVDQKHIVVFCVYYRDGINRDASGTLAPKRRPVGYKYVLKNSDKQPTLEEGGWYEWPAFVVRWSKVAGSVWGTSPAMILLSSIKMLNETEAQVWEARAKAIDPPVKVTEFGVVGDADLTPGGMVVVQDMNELEPLVNGTNWAEAENGIQRMEATIREGFFVDRLELKESPAMTATEVNARQERMMRLMAPTLGRLQNDMLNPLIENLFKMMLRSGAFKEMPDTLVDTDLDVEYTGPIPRAQKGEQAMGIERWISTLAQLATMHPALEPLLDNPDLDQVSQTLADYLGVPADLSKQDDEIRREREKRAEEQQRMQEAVTAEQEGIASKAMGEGAQAIDAATMGGPQGVVGG